MALKSHTWGDHWDENNCQLAHRNNRGADSVAPVYAYPEGVLGYTVPGTRAATSWSDAASGMTKPIPQTPPPAKSHSARNGAAAGAIPKSSPSAVRSAHSWFPKPSTISGDFASHCRYSRAQEERKQGMRCISRFQCRRLSFMPGETDRELVPT